MLVEEQTLTHANAPCSHSGIGDIVPGSYFREAGPYGPACSVDGKSPCFEHWAENFTKKPEDNRSWLHKLADWLYGERR